VAEPREVVTTRPLEFAGISQLAVLRSRPMDRGDAIDRSAVDVSYSDGAVILVSEVARRTLRPFRDDERTSLSRTTNESAEDE